MSWNVNHFKREFYYFRHAVWGEAWDSYRLSGQDPSFSKWDRVALLSDILMEIVCDGIQAFHYTLGHALVYGVLAWSCWSLFKLFW